MPAMKHTALIATLLLAPALATTASAQGAASAETLTNASVIQMFAAKVPKGLIVTKVQGTKSNFDITPAGLIQLNTSKVPNDVIKMMMTATGDTKKETLTNEAIIKMVTGQLSKDVIVQKIQMSKPSYDLTTTGLINLNQNKVSQDIIKAMMAATNGAPTKP